MPVHHSSSNSARALDVVWNAWILARFWRGGWKVGECRWCAKVCAGEGCLLPSHEVLQPNGGVRARCALFARPPCQKEPLQPLRGDVSTFVLIEQLLLLRHGAHVSFGSGGVPPRDAAGFLAHLLPCVRHEGAFSKACGLRWVHSGNGSCDPHSCTGFFAFALPSAPPRFAGSVAVFSTLQFDSQRKRRPSD